MSKDEKTTGKRYLSLKTHRKGPREMVTDSSGKRHTDSDAPSSRTTNTPLALTNGGVGSSGSIASNCHLKASDDSATSETDTQSLSQMVDRPLIERASTAPLSFQERTRSNASELFSSVEAMFLLQSRTRGVDGAYRLFCQGFPADLPEVRRLPAKLRAIAGEIEAITKIKRLL